MKLLTVLCWLLAVVAQAQPYEPRAIWLRDGPGDSSLYGSEILALGDQNDDGYNDWAVYAAGLGYAPAGSPNEPRVEFFHGGNPPDTGPYMVRVADRATEVSVRGARALGDLNGDGYVDWYIFTGHLGDTTGMHIYKIYFGGPGPHEMPDLTLGALWCDPLGDFNGDGYDDLLCSWAWGVAAAVLFGGSPMDTLPDWTRSLSLGYVATGGDLNHDGFADFVSSTEIYSMDIYLGAVDPDTVPVYHWHILSQLSAIVHDLNGDGFDELCMPRGGGGKVLWGGGGMDTTEDAHLDFPCLGSGPTAILSAGDFNGDGFGDVVMFRSWCENAYGGVLTLHLGGRWINPQPAFVVLGWTDPFNLMHFMKAACLGDVNGDHIDDLAVGANGGIEYIAQRGKVVVLAGDTSLIAGADGIRPELPSRLDVSVYPNPFNGSTNVEVQLSAHAREVLLAMYNLLGREVLTAKLPATAGRAVYQLDASAYPTGLYLLRVTSDNLHRTTKLMLLR